VPNANLPKILIVSASFGEGHNSAAKNIHSALKGKAIVRRADPCLEANPAMNRRLGIAYQAVINHTPNFWAALYYSTDMIDLNRPSKILTRKPEEAMHQHIKEFQPDAIVSTYPLYPYYIKRSFRKLPKVPLFTVVTDSIKINKSWTSAPTDYFLVTDSYTKSLMRKRINIPESRIVDLGFPVSPRFTKLESFSVDDKCSPFKVLYFPTGQKPQIRRNIRAILESHPDLRLTVVLGKNDIPAE